MKFMDNSKIQINQQKTEIILFAIRRSQINNNVIINNQPISQ